MRPNSKGKRGERGFTLIELIIVMAIIGVLAAIAAPKFALEIRRAREAVLKEDLHTMRSAIDSYTVDKEKAPQGLEDLVQGGYLKSVPIDPMTSRTDTWIVGQSQDLTTIQETGGGIDDVHSGSQAISSEGTTYTTW